MAASLSSPGGSTADDRTVGQDVRVLHVRVVTPASRREALVERMLAERSVLNVVVIPGAARKPDGDLVQFDVAREAANQVIDVLRSLDLHRVGSIAIERIDTALSDAHARAERQAPGDPSEAVIWEEVEARVRDESSFSASYVALLVIAVLIGVVAILTDSAILVVGAMVVGPEYGPLSSISLGLHKRRGARVRRGVVALVVGFGVAIAAGVLFGLAIRGVDHVPAAYEAGVRPVTDFISHPDLFTVVVAALAGVAGTLSLTESKAGTLVGVLVSVTTVPAASNVGLALAFGRGDEAWGALQQLGVNLVVLALVGAATLRVQALLWRRVAARRGAMASRAPDGP
jgi:uncharacterized hydrophobic protein (TIGR00271 family)